MCLKRLPYNAIMNQSPNPDKAKEQVMKITEKQWKLINSMALRIHDTRDLDEMIREFLSVINILVPYDRASFYFADEDNPYNHPIGVNLSDEELKLYIDNFAEMDPYIPLMGLIQDNQEPIRASDYAASVDLEKTEYYELAWKPKGIRYSMLLPMARQGVWIGSVNLFRHNDKEDFTDEELEISKILMEHLQIRLWRDKCSRNETGTLPDKSQDLRKQLIGEYGLTDRECEVVIMNTRGMTDMEICESMAISKNTLKKHISNIYSKLEISSRVELLKITGKK